MNLRFALVLLAGCVPGCPPDTVPRCELPDDIAPAETRDVEFGDPFRTPFWVYEEGEWVGRTWGGQGGSHINVGFRIAALPSDGDEVRCMQVQYQRTTATGTTFDRDSTFEFEREGDWWESTGIVADQDLVGRSTLRATVVDRLFTGSASVTIREAPEGFDGGQDIGVPDSEPPDAFDALPPEFEFDRFDYDPARQNCGPPAIESGTGQNLSPPISWHNVPETAGSLVLVARNRDDDAVHWVLYDIPPTMTELGEGVPAGFEVDGMRQARSDLNTEYSGYIGPCSDSLTRYEWILFAIEAEQLIGPDETTTGTEVVRQLFETEPLVSVATIIADL